MRDAQKADSAGGKLPTMTPAKRKQDLESPNGTFSTLMDATALLKDEILVVIGHVESLGTGSSVLLVQGRVKLKMAVMGTQLRLRWRTSKPAWIT